MSNAWETTVEDVLNICNMRLNMGLSEESAEIILSDLNHKAIEDAALYGEDINEQTCNAYDEIELQIKIKAASAKTCTDLDIGVSDALRKLFQSGG